MKWSLFFVTSLWLFAPGLYALERVPHIGDKSHYKTVFIDTDQHVYENQWTKKILDQRESQIPGVHEFFVEWESLTYKDQKYQYWTYESVLEYVNSTEKFCEQRRLEGLKAELEDFYYETGPLLSCKVTRLKGDTIEWYSEKVPFGLLMRIENQDNGESVLQILKGFYLSPDE